MNEQSSDTFFKISFSIVLLTSGMIAGATLGKYQNQETERQQKPVLEASAVQQRTSVDQRAIENRLRLLEARIAAMDYPYRWTNGAWIVEWP